MSGGRPLPGRRPREGDCRAQPRDLPWETNEDPACRWIRPGSGRCLRPHHRDRQERRREERLVDAGRRVDERRRQGDAEDSARASAARRLALGAAPARGAAEGCPGAEDQGIPWTATMQRASSSAPDCGSFRRARVWPRPASPITRRCGASGSTPRRSTSRSRLLGHGAREGPGGREQALRRRGEGRLPRRRARRATTHRRPTRLRRTARRRGLIPATAEAEREAFPVLSGAAPPVPDHLVTSAAGSVGLSSCPG